MPHTYTPWAMTNKDRVRMRLGDTDASAWLLDDDEINDLLSLHTLDSATAQAALAGAAKIARDVSRSVSGTVGGGSSSRNSRFDHLMRLADMWQQRAGGLGAVVPALSGFSGAQSEATKETQELDTDRVEPAFTRDLFQGHTS